MSDTPAPLSADSLREQLAAIEHERWSDWQKWMHSVLRKSGELTEGADEILQRWDKQIATPYDKLSDQEKASDMEQVDRYWPLIKSYVATALQSQRQRIADSLPEKKTLETDLPLNAWEDDARFCIECGQFEQDGILDCKCVGFNEAIATVRALLEAEGSRLTSKGESE